MAYAARSLVLVLSPSGPLADAGQWLNARPSELFGAQRPVLLHFWNVSSQKCIEELPMLRGLAARFDAWISVVGIYSEVGQKTRMAPPAIQRAVELLHLLHPIALDTRAGSLAGRFLVQRVPTYLLFDANGELRHRGSTIALLQMAVESVLAHPRAPHAP